MAAMARNLTNPQEQLHMTTNFKYIKAGSIAFITLTAALLQPLAYGQTQAKPAGDSMQQGSKAGASSMSGGAMDMKGMMKDSNDKMGSMQTTGNPDIDFATIMRMHHQGAIDMAEVELRDGKNPQMRKMAKDIIAAQKKEIAQFDKFLAKQPAGKMNK